MELPCTQFSRDHYVGRTLLVFALLWAAALQPAVGQSCRITDLGTLPGGAFSTAYGINSHGDVVGEATTASGASHAFLFDDGVMTDLGTLPLAAPFEPFSQARAINDRGQVVGNSNTGSGARSHAFLFDDGVMVDLGPFPGGIFEIARGINDRGQIVGGLTTASASHAALCTLTRKPR